MSGFSACAKGKSARIASSLGDVVPLIAPLASASRRASLRIYITHSEMVRSACPTEHELLARAYGVPVTGDIDAHLAECAECRVVLSELARSSRDSSEAITGAASAYEPGA